MHRGWVPRHNNTALRVNWCRCALRQCVRPGRPGTHDAKATTAWMQGPLATGRRELDDLARQEVLGPRAAPDLEDSHITGRT